MTTKKRTHKEYEARVRYLQHDSNDKAAQANLAYRERVLVELIMKANLRKKQRLDKEMADRQVENQLKDSKIEIA